MLAIANRRDALRLAREHQIHCNGYQTTMLNLSVTGARLVMKKLEETVTLHFQLGDHLMSLEGDVVWSQQCGCCYIVGVTFRTPPKEQLSALRNHVLCNYYGLWAA